MRRPSRTATIVIAATIAACANGDEVEVGDPGRLVLWNGDSISVLEDEQSSEVDTTGTVGQVTPGPDGTLVWTHIEQDPPSVAAVLDGSSRVSIATPTVPFFYEWSPTGERVAWLGNAPSGAGLVFGLIDVETEELTTTQSPPPVFFDWSPDGESLVAHIGGSVLAIVDAATGDVRELPLESGTFPAPLWTERGIVVAASVGPTVSGTIVPVAYQTGGSEIVLIDPADDSTVTLTDVDGAVRLFAADDALAIAVGPAGSQRIEVIGWDGEARATLGQGTIDLVQWSPDGSTLLWTERDGTDDLTPITWAGGDTAAYDAFQPSAEFAGAYLPFWDQYDRTISLWAGNSAAFLLPTADGVVVHTLDGTSSTYEGWDMGVWTVGSPQG